MGESHLIGLDYGSESARGVLVDVRSGAVLATHTHTYTHGVMSSALPDGTTMPLGWALQDASDYEEAAAAILGALGRGRSVRGIGLGFTASSPLPAMADGMPLSCLHPGVPHAYVKLWKHAAAQAQAERISARGGDHLADVGGRLSANSLLAKAAEMAEEAPTLWAEADRFIEAGDWLAWRLTGRETRSAAFAAYKADWRAGSGYPVDAVPGLGAKLGDVHPVGAAAGALTPAWRERTGIGGEAVVAVPVIDSHSTVPATGAVEGGTLVAALGTSAVYLLLDDVGRPLPPGIEGRAFGGVVPGLWCHEAGQAAFGDMLGWFVRAFPRGDGVEISFAAYDAAAAALAPGEAGVVALDWWNGNRVPHGDARLSGLFTGMTLRTTAADLYRALLESLCFGARTVVDRFIDGGVPVERVVMTSGLSLANPLLMQIMADVLGRDVAVPRQAQLTAVGSAIHAAVACGVARDYGEAARRFGARDAILYRPDPVVGDCYDALYRAYRTLGDAAPTRDAMLALRAAAPRTTSV
ncbi:carbohydrate kinase [Lichenibacterium minor]|uniref:Carbohydrate kinase n=1 Tax=Lichenibacterium minor TaxID=2316528 RepID=A0A4Q2U2L4_9HYPH|nr:FGGY-family carbohydrate kinase [Lichenibacterium minor]RYC29111.1 carbohydrate kinase [Lichenibacterium minor]